MFRRVLPPIVIGIISIINAGLLEPAAQVSAQRPQNVVAPEPLLKDGRTDKIRIVYFVPLDREPTPRYRAKLHVLMTFVSDLFVKTLAEDRGIPMRGLVINQDADGIQVSLVRGKHPCEYYTSNQYSRIRTEVDEALGSSLENLFLVFAETYGFGPSSHEWPNGIANGLQYSSTGGLGIFSAWILREEFCATSVQQQLRFLADATPIRGRTAAGHGRPDSPRFEFIEDGFGAVAHELGHALGLQHDFRNNHWDIMANGFRNLRVMYFPGLSQNRVLFSKANARLLRWSRFLCEEVDRTDTTPPHVTLECPQALPTGTRSVLVTLQASDDRALGAVCYTDTTTFEGVTVVDGFALSGKHVRMEHTLAVDPLKRGSLTLTATVTDRGGNHRAMAVTILVE